MPRPIALFVPLLGLCSAAAWWLLQPGTDDAALAPPDASASRRHDTAPPEHGDPSAAPIEAAASQTHAAAARDAVQQVGSLLPIPDDAVWIEVRIVDAETQQPVPDAEVHWYDDQVTQRAWQDATQPGSTLQILDFWRDPEQIASAFGWHTHSDRQGIARVHQTRSTKVVARQGNRYGTAQVGRHLLPPRGGHRVEIAPDRELRVQVLDATGQPAFGIPVALAAFGADGKFRQMRGWGSQAETKAPDGIAVLRHLQQPDPDSSPAIGAITWKVRTFVPGMADPAADVALDPPPTEPVVLRLPPTGEIRVRIEPPESVDAPNRLVSLQRSSKDRNHDSNLGWAEENRTLFQPVGTDGTARFRWVALGSTYSAILRQPGRHLSETVSGPQAPGAVIEVVLRQSPGQITVAGRLVDEQRAPLAKVSFQLQMQGKNLRVDESLRTDADGGFRFLMRRPTGEGRAETIRIQHQPEGQPTQIGTVPPRTIQATLEDLGDIVVGLEPLVAGGTWSAPGKPRDWVPTVQVQAFLDRQGRGPEWRRTSEPLTQHFDTAGAFAIRGQLRPGRYRLSFGSDQHLPLDPIEFRLGQDDLRLEFPGGALLRASVLLPKLAYEEPFGTLVPLGQTAWTDAIRRRLTATGELTDGRWQLTWPSLPPGAYRLEIGLKSLPRPLVVLDDVVVPLPAAGDDRLVDIDLSQLLRVVHVQLQGTDGSRLSANGALACLMPQDGAQDLRGTVFWGGEAQILLPRDPVELLVAMLGRRPQTVLCSGDRLELRMEPWPVVTLVFADLPRLPDGLTLEANLQAETPTARRYQARWQDGELSDLVDAPTAGVEVQAGRAEVPIGEGPHRVEVFVRGKHGRSRLAFDAPRLLLAGGEVTVALPAAALAKAIAARQKADQEREQNQSRR